MKTTVKTVPLGMTKMLSITARHGDCQWTTGALLLQVGSKLKQACEDTGLKIVAQP